MGSLYVLVRWYKICSVGSVVNRDMTVNDMLIPLILDDLLSQLPFSMAVLYHVNESYKNTIAGSNNWVALLASELLNYTVG